MTKSAEASLLASALIRIVDVVDGRMAIAVIVAQDYRFFCAAVRLCLSIHLDKLTSAGSRQWVRLVETLATSTPMDTFRHNVGPLIQPALRIWWRVQRNRKIRGQC